MIRVGHLSGKVFWLLYRSTRRVKISSSNHPVHHLANIGGLIYLYATLKECHVTCLTNFDGICLDTSFEPQKRLSSSSVRPGLNHGHTPGNRHGLDTWSDRENRQ